MLKANIYNNYARFDRSKVVRRDIYIYISNIAAAAPQCPVLSRASPPFVGYYMDHVRLFSPRRGHGPSLLDAVESQKRTQPIHESCDAHASGLGAESVGAANIRRKKKAC